MLIGANRYTAEQVGEKTWQLFAHVEFEDSFGKRTTEKHEVEEPGTMMEIEKLAKERPNVSWILKG